MDRDEQADAIGNHQAGVEGEIDPIADHPTIDDLAAGTGKGEDKEPQRRTRRGFVASLPLSESLNPKRGKQEKRFPNRSTQQKRSWIPR